MNDETSWLGTVLGATLSAPLIPKRVARERRQRRERVLLLISAMVSETLPLLSI